MATKGYDVMVGDQLKHLDMVDAQRARAPAGLEPIEVSLAKRSADWFTVFLLLVAPVAASVSWIACAAILAAVASLVLTVHLRVFVKLSRWAGPPDEPQVIAVIKAPDRLFCPRCGEERTDNYCAVCGINVEKEYRKMVRHLVKYVVIDTESQRNFLSQSVGAELARVASEQRAEIEEKMIWIRRQHDMEIARIHRSLRNGGGAGALPSPTTPRAEDTTGSKSDSEDHWPLGRYVSR